MIFSFWNPLVGFSLACIAKLLARKINIQKIFSICHNIKPHEQKWIDKKLIKFYTSSFDKFIFMSSFVENELDEFKKSYKSVVDIYHLIVLIKNMIKLSLGMKMGIHQKIK